MAVDAGFDGLSGYGQIYIACAVRFEKRFFKLGAYGPVALQGVYVALGYAALQVACQVLQVFGLLAVDVAWQVEVVVVFGYFI